MAHVITPIKQSAELMNDDLAEIANGLGLAVQEKRYAARNSIEADFRPLSADELWVWRAFCRTAYRAGGTGQTFVIAAHPEHYAWLWEIQLELQGYGHDLIPSEVLRHWSKIKSRYPFDLFEIRTTEATPFGHDPLLFGYYAGAAYLLARWGLESPEELPFREVTLRVKKMREEQCGVQKFLWSETRRYERDPLWNATNRILADA